MNRFKVGDIVVGLPGNGYNFTGEGSICKVKQCWGDDMIRVEVIVPTRPDKARDLHIGMTYPVECVGFKLKKERPLENE